MKVKIPSLMKEIEFLKKVSKITKSIEILFEENEDQSDQKYEFKHEKSITEILKVFGSLTT